MKVQHLVVKNFRGIKSLSWVVKGDFCCLIGPGDSSKTTILSALDYALSPRASLLFDDSDFFNQDVDQDIVIQVTLTDWDESQPDVQKFFQESKYAQYKCGLSESGPLSEPEQGGIVAVSISLRVDKSLEPKWFVVKGLDEGEGTDKKPLYGSDRALFGLSRIDIFSDFHFTWGRNTILTRLSADSAQGNLGTILSTLTRDVRQSDISNHPSIAACQTVADEVKQESGNAGVNLSDLSPKIDIQRQSLGAGALSLHEDQVPLRNKGSGSKRLIGTAMQMKLHGGKSISLIDEIEVGLEPHRIRGLLYKLKNSAQQIFTTTHSSVVIRELIVADNELYFCNRDDNGTVSVTSLAAVPDFQGAVRTNAEAFLGGRIVACEGLTEIGCLRAYDIYRFDAENAPVWSLATSYFDCRGAGKIKVVCPKLLQLGYETAILCDNDAPTQLSASDVQALQTAGAHVCQWESGNSTEHQLVTDLPWDHVPQILQAISENHDTLEHATILDCIRSAPGSTGIDLSGAPDSWPDSPTLRRLIGDLAHDGKWIKRIDYAEKIFQRALPILPDTGVLKARLAALWDWIQRNER